MKVFIKGLNSCGMRRVNTQRYRDFLISNGHEIVPHPSLCDTILLWTCAFRGDFRDNSVSEIHRYMKDYSVELIVAGCLPDIDRRLLIQEYPGRFINWRDDEEGMENYFGAPSKRLNDVTRVYGEKPICNDIEAFRKRHPQRDVTFVDQFVKLFVAEGCKYKCAYCAEILAFPRFQSFPIRDLVKTCKELVEETGNCNVMLLGDDIGDYGCDIGLTLPDLIQELLGIHPRIKIGLQGFNPANFLQYFDELATFIRHGKILHLQLPIQSASDRILKRMNRPYSKQDITKIFTHLNQLGFTAIDTHILVGFPGEGEKDFEETIEFVLYHRPHYILVSKYMETDSMPSAGLSDKVPREVQNLRIKEAGLRIRQKGIICNSDDSDLSTMRCQNMNRIESVA